jgi:hypothetical protein
MCGRAGDSASPATATRSLGRRQPIRPKKRRWCTLLFVVGVGLVSSWGVSKLGVGQQESANGDGPLIVKVAEPARAAA